MLMRTIFIFSVLVLVSGCATHWSSYHPSMGRFERDLNYKERGFKIVEDPTGSAPTKLVERFEVLPGDCASNRDWNDCTTQRERSELAGPKENHIGTEFWYGWYMYIPNDWKDVTPANNFYGQFYQDKAGPLYMIEMTNSGLRVHNALKYQYSQYYDIEKMRGKWTKIEIHAKWAQEMDGVMPDAFFNAYVNDELIYAFKGNTASSYGENRMYFKYGIYRAMLNRLGGPAPAQVVYYAGLSRAKTRAGLFQQR